MRDNSWNTSGAIGVGRWADDVCLRADLELSDADVPSLDDLACADLELEGATFGNAGVEDCAVEEATGVVDDCGGAIGGLRSRTFLSDLNFELVCSCHYYLGFN